MVDPETAEKFAVWVRGLISAGRLGEQGRSDPQRELLEVESVAGNLLPQSGVFAFRAGHRRELFSDELFTDLFATSRGHPSVPIEVVASVLMLQTTHSLSDQEAVEARTFDLRWTAACGLAITDPSFHPTTLTYGQRRLAASGRPERIFDTVQAVVTQTGALAGRASSDIRASSVLASPSGHTQAGRRQPPATPIVTAPSRPWSPSWPLLGVSNRCDKPPSTAMGNIRARARKRCI